MHKFDSERRKLVLCWFENLKAKTEQLKKKIYSKILPKDKTVEIAFFKIDLEGAQFSFRVYI